MQRRQRRGRELRLARRGGAIDAHERANRATTALERKREGGDGGRIRRSADPRRDSSTVQTSPVRMTQWPTSDRRRLERRGQPSRAHRPHVAPIVGRERPARRNGKPLARPARPAASATRSGSRETLRARIRSASTSARDSLALSSACIGRRRLARSARADVDGERRPRAGTRLPCGRRRRGCGMPDPSKCFYPP